MARPRKSTLLPAMLTLLVVVFFVVLGYTLWLDTRVRPASEAAPVTVTVPASVPAPRAEVAPQKSLNRCVAPGRAPVYTADACPVGTTLDREIEVARMAERDPAVERARLQCEAAKQRERIELARLGNRRATSDVRLWGDYVLRECAVYQASLEP